MDILTQLIIELAAIGAACVALVLYFSLGGKKQKVFVFERESKVSFGLFKAIIKKEGTPSITKLVLGKDRFDLPEGTKPFLLRKKVSGAKYDLMYFVQNGVLIAPSDQMQDPFDPLMQPKDLASDGEKKVLGWLTNVRANTTDRFAILIGAAVGLGIGYMLFSYWHPGLVQGPPDGYKYIVEHLNSTSTSVSH